jgi:undecaprenyl-diphosphatase
MTSIMQTIILGLIQGITEFLPVSSSAHLIFIPNLLGWSQRGIAFDVATHLGTLTAVLLYYRVQLWQITQDMLQAKNTPNSKLGLQLILATIPVGLAGIIFEKFIDQNLRTDHVIAISTIIFALILLLAQIYHNKHKPHTTPTMFESVFIGLAQILALIPGASRSGVTLSAGLFAKLDKANAAKFSFMLSIPVIAAAGMLQIYKIMFNNLAVNMPEIIIGFSVSAISGYFCIKVFISLLECVGLLPFIIYRILLGIALLAYL